MSEAKSLHRPSILRVAHAVGWVTFLEVIRDRVLYNIILCAFILFALGFLASRLTFIRPERVILDFGLSAVMISCSMIATFTGASLLGKEFERRTIYVALCHPITRAQFVLGKFVGLVGVLVINWVLLSSIYLMMLSYSCHQPFELYSETLFVGLFLALVQSILISSISLLFSTISTTSISVICTIGLYLIGNNITQLKLVASKLQSAWGNLGLSALATVLPNLEYFNLGTKVTYGLPITSKVIFVSLGYGFFVITLFLILAGLFVQGREV